MQDPIIIIMACGGFSQQRVWLSPFNVR